MDDLRALIRTLEAGPATLIGHSYGGLVSLALAARSAAAVEAFLERT